jgi:hypothetical protein
MILQDFLAQKRSPVLKKWFDLILKDYPQETQGFLEREKNPFANPVGFNILEGIEGLYDELLKGSDFTKASFFLDPIIRIRAVQDFSPSMAVAFIPSLKQIIKGLLPSETSDNRLLWEDLREFESRIDKLTLLAFDTYMACREKIYEIRVNEMKNRSARVLERIHSAPGERQQKPDPQDGGMGSGDSTEKGKMT